MKKRILAAAALCALSFCIPARAESGSLLSVTEEAQIRPIGDGSGKYMLKSDGFYCLNADGSAHRQAAVHYFDHYVIDGTVFTGYYYHDGEGKFRAQSSHVEHLKGLTAAEPAENTELYEAGSSFDGYYMVNNLGRLSAAPQVRYIDGLSLDGLSFSGWFYFDGNGRMDTSGEIHYADMVCNGRTFDGYYYFGGTNGALVQEAGSTPDGFPVEEDGRVSVMDNLGMETLRPQLRKMIFSYDGKWSVYVKNLDTDEELVFNNRSLYSASLIKMFVMEGTYRDMDTVLERQAARMNADASGEAVREKVDDLLWNMITVSDNESFNELVRLQSENHDFREGAGNLNGYLEGRYAYTSVQHTLHPANSGQQSLGGRNMTSVKDCGNILEAIFDGQCVSGEASEKMLELLLNQQNTTKIPAGLPEGVVCANKTGETDQDQHDIAIVYGPETTYILCVLSEDCPDQDVAVQHIRDISRVVYNYLNLRPVSSGGEDSQ